MIVPINQSEVEAVRWFVVLGPMAFRDFDGNTLFAVEIGEGPEDTHEQQLTKAREALQLAKAEALAWATLFPKESFSVRSISDDQIIGVSWAYYKEGDVAMQRNFSSLGYVPSVL